MGVILKHLLFYIAINYEVSRIKVHTFTIYCNNVRMLHLATITINNDYVWGILTKLF